MIRHDVVEKLFDVIDEMSMILVSNLSWNYLDAICGACQNLVENDILQDVNTDSEVQLFNLCKQVGELEFSREEVRKALQLALLKGLKSKNASLDMMTPDSIAIVIGYLSGKLISDMSDISIGDFSVGTGNLLTAFLNNIEVTSQNLYGVDDNYEMLKLAKMMADMQEYEVQFYHQSSASPMAVPQFELLIGDLPVGEIDPIGLDLEIANVGCKYLPYLLVENHLRYLAPGGYGIYVIPNDFFSQKFAADFHSVIVKSAHIQMLLQLPESMFKDAGQTKSLFVIQKQGLDVRPVDEVLAVAMPDFSEIEKFREMLTNIDNWIKLNKAN